MSRVGSLLPVFLKAAKNPSSWASAATLETIVMAPMDDWRLLQKKGVDIFPNFAVCLKETMLWVMRYNKQLVTWKTIPRASKEYLQDMCVSSERCKSGVGNVLLCCSFLFLERLRLGKIDMGRKHRSGGKPVWSFAKCLVPRVHVLSSAVWLGLVALGIYDGDNPCLQTCQSISMHAQYIHICMHA